MLTNHYIQFYVDSKKQAAEQVQSDLDAVGRNGLDLFRQNVATWLGGFMDEIEPGEYEYKTQLTMSAEMIVFLFPFTWQGIPGAVRSEDWGKKLKTTRPQAYLTFKVGDYTFTKKLTSDYTRYDDGAYTEVAKPLPDIELGEMLFDVQKRIEENLKNQADQAERNRRYEIQHLETLFREKDTLEEVFLHKADCLEAFPAESERWNAAEKRAVQHLTALEEARQAEEAHQAELKAERDLLKQQVRDLFIGLTVYRIISAIGQMVPHHDSDPNEPAILQNTDYALSDEPDPHGYYTCVSRGEEHRKRINNILTIEPVKIDGIDHYLVNEIYRAKRVASIRFPDEVSVTFWLAPGQVIF